METTDSQSPPSQIEIAQTIVAGLATRPIVKLNSKSAPIERTPDEERTYRRALAVLLAYLDEPPPASLAEMRLSVRALHIAEARGVATLKEFMAMTPAEFADMCSDPKSSNTVAREFMDLRNFMLRPVGPVEIAKREFDRMTFVEGKDALRHEQAESGKV